MVIIFKNKNAREQLLKNGIVYTFRKNKHKEGFDWATDKYRGEKIANIHIMSIGSYRPTELAMFVSSSGFKTLNEWISAISEFGINENKQGHLYLVQKI